jgi:ubiquinone/menaquinone biosynthesis C-methylase UbiE
MVNSKEWKSIDRSYHEKADVVGSYDRRITEKYRLEHKYLNLDLWVAELARRKAGLVLDFGCGTGVATMKLLEKKIPTISIDLSRTMLEYVKQKAAAAGYSSQCVVADVEHLPFKDGAFDGLICCGVLHHLPNIPVAVESQIAAVKPGAPIYITEPFHHKSWLSLPYYAVLSVLKLIRNLIRGNSAEGLLERPLKHPDIQQIAGIYQRRAVRFSTRFILFWPLVFHYLPEPLSAVLIRLLNWLNSFGRRGDSVMIEASRKE